LGQGARATIVTPGGGRPASREAYKDSLAHTRQMLEGRVAGPTAGRRPTSRPASSRQIDSAEVFPLPPHSPSSMRSALVVTSPPSCGGAERPRSAGLGATSPTLAADEPVVSDASSASSPECAIKVFGAPQHEPLHANAAGSISSSSGKAATKRPASERADRPHKPPGESAAGVGGVRQEYHGRVVSGGEATRKQASSAISAQRRARSVSRDARPHAPLTGKAAAHATAKARPTSTHAHAWQQSPDDAGSVAMLSRVHRAQRVYLGTSSQGGGVGAGGKVDPAAAAASSNVGLSFGSRKLDSAGTPTNPVISGRIVDQILSFWIFFNAPIWCRTCEANWSQKYRKCL